MTDIRIFDSMVDDLLNGEHLVAEFDTGISVYVDTEMVTVCYSNDDEVIEINLDGEEIDYLHLFLEALFAARQQIKNINWDDLLSGN